MKQAKVTLWGKYHYKINLEGNETLHDVAMKIALEVHRKENKTKFTGKPRTYNYIYECLVRKSCLNFRINTEDSNNNEKELLKAANDLNSKSEFVWNEEKQVYEHQAYRLGYTQSNTLIIDIDGKDKINLIRVKDFYESVLNCKFTVIGTKNGYWLFSDKKYEYLRDWLYDHCRVLSPNLKYEDFESYKEELLMLDEGFGGKFERATPEVIKKSGLYGAPEGINFDVAFTFLSIKRQRSTIRITKKSKDDKIELVKL